MTSAKKNYTFFNQLQHKQQLPTLLPGAAEIEKTEAARYSKTLYPTAMLHSITTQQIFT
jgi:hypothetical protein